MRAFLVALTCLLASCAPKGASDRTWTHLAQRARSLVVRVEAVGDEDGRGRPRAGSGFFVSESHVLTTWTAIAKADEIRLRAPDGSWTGARIIGTDKDNDLALLEPVPPPSAPAAPLELAAALPAPGSEAMIAGYPGHYGLSVVRTTVSAAGVPLEGDTAESLVLLQGSPRKGLGGAPVLDEKGRVVALVLPREDKTHGFAPALPATVLAPVIAALQAGEQKSVSWADLGITMSEVPQLRSLRIDAVSEGSVAALAGLLSGDVIVGMAERRTESLEFAQALLSRWRSEHPITLVVQRGDKQVRIGLKALQ